MEYTSRYADRSDDLPYLERIPREPKRSRSCELSDSAGTYMLGAAALILAAGTIFLACTAFKGLPNINSLSHAGIGYGLFGVGAVLTTAATITTIYLFKGHHPSTSHLEPIESTEGQLEKVAVVSKGKSKTSSDSSQSLKAYSEQVLKELWGLKDDKIPSKLWSERPAQVKPTWTNLDPKYQPLREGWIKQGTDAGLQMCHCKDFNIRAQQEAYILEKLKRFPPDQFPEISFLSLGSGHLLQDWLLIRELKEAGYKRIKVQVVDPALEQPYVDKLQDIAKRANIDLTINCAREINEVAQEKRFHFAHAIDFENLDKDLRSWEDVCKTAALLKPDGFIFTSAMVHSYTYEEKLKAWSPIPDDYFDMIPPAVPQKNTVRIAYMDSYFSSNELWILVDLVRKGYQSIEIDLMNGSPPRELLKTIEALTQTKNVFKIRTIESLQPDNYQLVVGNGGRLGRNNMPEVLKSLQDKAILFSSGGCSFYYIHQAANLISPALRVESKV